MLLLKVIPSILLQHFPKPEAIGNVKYRLIYRLRLVPHSRAKLSSRDTVFENCDGGIKIFALAPLAVALSDAIYGVKQT